MNRSAPKPPFEKGKAAAAGGYSRSYNPYRRGTADSNEWIRGFEIGQAEQDRREADDWHNRFNEGRSFDPHH